MGEWTSTGVTNLNRRKSGVYYAETRVDGRLIRKSLQTKKRDIARIKLPGALADILDSSARSGGDVPGVETLEGCLVRWEAEQLARPDIKDSQKDYCVRRVRVIRETLPCGLPVAGITDGMIGKWWADIASRYHVTYANNLLAVLVVLLDMQVKGGYRRENPARELKRVKQTREIRNLPSPTVFSQLVASVRGQRKRGSEEAGDFIEWAAYTGMRPAEIAALMWDDVGGDFIVVRGGADGTKNRKERLVPIMSALVPIIERRRQRGGTVFQIKSPKRALDNVCDRLGIDHLRVYDLRHLFATRCIESGVDFATVAKWLGHSDGGALAARVYGHVRDAHGLEQAKRVGF